jgi:glutamate--cysteine ligase catalytic subunit
MVDRGYEKDVIDQINLSLNFLLRRAKGEIKTGARMIRDFVHSHPEYKNDSIITNKIAYDIISTIVNISNNPEYQEKLFGNKWMMKL